MVASVEGFFAGLLKDPGRSDSLDSAFLAVIRVFTTQIGLVMRTVALPAIAPAIMDSMVVSLDVARADLMAARSKNARVHSYPVPSELSFLSYFIDRSWRRTVIVDEVGHTYAKQRRVQA